MKPRRANAGDGPGRRGDAVVEQPSAGAQQSEQPGEVLVEPGRAHVLEHADGADGVERSVDDVAVVLHADLDAVGEPGLAYRRARPLRLTRRQRDADRGRTVLARGVDDHAAPAAADVEQAHPRTQTELAAHQLVLGGLRGFERGVGSGEDRARVGHRRPEHEPVEVVRDVVVVRDRDGVAFLAVTAAARADLLGRRRQRPQPLDSRGAREQEPFARRDLRRRAGCRARSTPRRCRPRRRSRPRRTPRAKPISPGPVST